MDALAVGEVDQDEEAVFTLEQAVRNKYSIQEDDYIGQIKEYSLSCKPGICPVQWQTSIVLDNRGICEVSKTRDLAELCPRVEEIHLASNRIAHWNDITKMLCSMPRLSFLNLGHNPINSSTFVSNGMTYDQLSALVLNGTAIDLMAVETCLKSMPLLRELHLSMNNYSDVQFTPSFTHSKLHQLHINSNKINTWAGFQNLGHAFPNLEILVASGNPIEDISMRNSENFPKLHTLNLNDSSLSSWKSIEYLNTLCKLKELSVLKIPLGKDFEEKKRRYAFIARLPKIQKLNKSYISESEREEAEKWLVRELRDVKDPPRVYKGLVKKYGSLNPSVNVNLNLVKAELKSEDENSCTYLTLEKAIRDSLTNKPGICSAEWQTSIVLDNRGICEVSKTRDLAELCPRVEELHLRSNRIAHWNDVTKILCSMPRLSFLNLGHNPLNSSTFKYNGMTYDQLSTLILNGTCITLVAVETCLKSLPHLQELHLSMNNYSDVQFTPSFTHSKLHQLHISNNQICTWAGFQNLGHAFPNLEILVASGNPIEDISMLNSEYFPKLHTLNLNDSFLSSWKSIEYLDTLCKLKELSVLKIPLGKDLDEMKRRYAFIARLPKIQKLNKSVVTESEREEAKIWLFGDVSDPPDPPDHQDLVERYSSLPDVNLKPDNTELQQFHFEDENTSFVQDEERDISLYDKEKSSLDHNDDRNISLTLEKATPDK